MSSTQRDEYDARPDAGDWPYLFPETAPIRRSVRGSRALVANRRDHISDARLRTAFVARRDGELPPPIVRLSRMGSISLRLHLTLVWLAACGAVNGEEYADLRLDDLTQVLGLPDERQTMRRVADALRALDRTGLIKLASSRPRGLRGVRLGREDRLTEWSDDAGPFVPHTAPDYETAATSPFLDIPSGLWTQGWLAVLPNPALVVLLALMHSQGVVSGGGEPGRVFLSESVRAQRYGFSEDTYYLGRRQLEELGLIRLRWDDVRSGDPSGRTRATGELRTWILKTDPLEARTTGSLPRLH